ncbi:MAG: PAS domain S-box protein [Bacteroidota bacterium]
MPYRFLILEDNPRDVDLMIRYLKRADLDFTYHHVEKGAEYQQALTEFQPDLILSDFNLPSFDGLEAIKIKNQSSGDTPLIIVSATVGDEVAVELMKKGATDYVLKENLEKLPHTVTRTLEQQRALQKRKEIEEQNKRYLRRLNYLFDNSLDAIFLSRPDGQILDANPAACEMFGYSHQEICAIGRSGLMDESDPVNQAAIRERAEEGVYKGVLNMTRSNGDSFAAEVTTRIEKDDQGVESAYVICRDISERIQTMQELEADRKLLQLQKDIAFVVNENLSLNDALRQCLQKIHPFLNSQIGHLFFIHPNKHTISSSEIWVTPDDHDYSIFRKATRQADLETTTNLINTVIEQKTPYWIADLHKFDNYVRIQAADKEGLVGAVVIPILVQDETVAALEFYFDHPTEQDQALMDQLMVISTQIGRLIERHEALRELQAQERQYRLLAENSSDVVIQSRDGGRITYVSPSIHDMLGYDPQEILGSYGEEWIHPDDMENYQLGREKLYGDEDQWKTIVRVRHKKGHYIWVEMLGTTVYDKQGEIHEVQTALRDVTDRVKTHQALEQEKEFNDQLINSLPGLFFLINEDLQVIKVNNNFSRLLGFDKSLPENNQPLALSYVREDQQHLAKQSIREAFEEGHTEIELDIISLDGHTTPFWFTGVTIQRHGETLLLGTGINISDRKKAETQLLQEKNFVDRAINSLPGLFYVINADQEYVRVNDNFIDELGYSWEEVQQMHPLDFYPEAYHELISQAIQQAFEDGEAGITAQIQTKDGRLPWYQLTGAYVTQGGKDYILGTGINITDRIETEQHLKETLDENRVLLAEVHHRVKNNLAVIAGILQLQSFDIEDETVKRKLRDSDMRIKSIARIHEQLYQSKQFSSLRLDEHIELLVHEIKNTYQVSSPVDLQLDLEPLEISMNQAIPVALILHELISNSFKHGAPLAPDPHLRIGLSTDDEQVKILVSDNGPGLPDNFNLQQADSLGMELVTALTDQLGATINYSDAPRTTFELLFDIESI